jgi:hypothetical protein
MAIIQGMDPKSPGGVDRSFLQKAKGEYLYLLPEGLAPGDAIEVGGDYFTGSGRRDRQRWYGFVLRIKPEHLVLRKCKTAAEAFRQGALYRAAKTGQKGDTHV